MSTQSLDPRLKKQLLIMLAIVIGMFCFCYALVPIYTVFCKVTGLNGKTDGQVAPAMLKVDKKRTVTVELLSTLNESLPGAFKSEHKKFVLHPGEYVSTTYHVSNFTNQPMVVQAIPSVTPGLAAQHVKKIQCFCFEKQPLDPLENKDLPLVFTVDPALPTSIHTITLAYTLFDVTKNEKGSNHVSSPTNT